jgi:hypothetical protein
MDGERCDFRIAALSACHRVPGDAPTHFGHHEEVPATGVEFQKVPARPRFLAEAGAFNAHDPLQMAQTEGYDLDSARQTALAVESPQSM